MHEDLPIDGMTSTELSQRLQDDYANKIDADWIARAQYAETDREHWHLRDDFQWVLPPDGRSAVVEWTIPDTIWSGKFGGGRYKISRDLQKTYAVWVAVESRPQDIERFAERVDYHLRPEQMMCVLAVLCYELDNETDTFGLMPIVTRIPVDSTGRVITDIQSSIVVDLDGHRSLEEAKAWVSRLHDRLTVPFTVFSLQHSQGTHEGRAVRK